MAEPGELKEETVTERPKKEGGERDEKQDIRFYFCFDADGFPVFWGLRASGGEGALDHADHLGQGVADS
jgi:hypothetical protein